MRDIILTSKYKKDLKAAQKTPRFKKYSTKLVNYLATLQRGDKLPPEADDHQLAKHSTKEYSRCREFKAAPDVCVVYRMSDDSIELVRIGQHNNLGLTENI